MTAAIAPRSTPGHLLRAAELLDELAEDIKASSTVGGMYWDDLNDLAKYYELLCVAGALRERYRIESA